MLNEFKKFILKGNMLELAVAVILGGAFSKVVTAFTDILLAAIGKIGSQPDFSQYKPLGFPVGVFLNSIISLLIVGFALFLIVKVYTIAKSRFEKPASTPEPTSQEKLLAEIRDLLKQKS